MKVVRLTEEKNKRKTAVRMLEHMLEAAKKDEAIAFCGVVLLGNNQVGTFRSEILLEENFYVVLGALEDLKHEILIERDIDEGTV